MVYSNISAEPETSCSWFELLRYNEKQQ